MLKKIFYEIDKLLPRFLARLPYQIAELDIAQRLRSKHGAIKVWSRNSVKTSSFVVGISDLDLTIVAPKELGKSLFSDLKTLKKKWKFLGESTLYNENDLILLVPSINWYELNRDADLVEFLAKENIYANSEYLIVDKLIYLLRLLQSDTQLENYPAFRQRKWRHHCLELGLPEADFFDRNMLLTVIKNALRNEPLLIEGLVAWNLKRLDEGFNVFQSELPDSYKVLYPHQFLWFNQSDDADVQFLDTLNSFAKNVIKRQIDWEVWGIYSQRFWLENKSMKVHLERLMRVYECVANQSEQNRTLRLIETFIM